MMIEPRPYRDAADLESMEAILVAGRKADKSSFYVHVGDLRLWLYYTLPEDQPWSRIYLWETEQREVVAWTMFSIADEAFDLFMMPELHGNPEMYSMLAWSADRMSEILRQAGASTMNKMWNHPQDSALRHALEQSGFSISNDPEIKKFRDSAQEKMANLLLGLVQEGKEQGQIRADISEDAFRAYFKAFMGIFTDPHFRQLYYRDPKLAQDLGALMIYGLSG